MSAYFSMRCFSIRYFCRVFMLCALLIFMSIQTMADSHAHDGHSDALMVLLGHKIALQKLQKQLPTKTILANQREIIQQAMPVLQAYMSTPKSFYLNAEMYHDSLENRGAMLADYSTLLIEYQKQLVSLP